MAARSPLIGARPLSTPMALRPHTTSTKNSGEPKLNTSGRRIGSDASRTKAPSTPPTAGRHEGSAEGAFSLALAGHGVAVQDGRLRARAAGYGDEHRGEGVGGVGDRADAQQEGDGVVGAHGEAEGEDDGEDEQNTHPGKRREHAAKEHASHHQQHGLRLQDSQQPLIRGLDHSGCPASIAVLRLRFATLRTNGWEASLGLS